jgi:hypothetical protein
VTVVVARARLALVQVVVAFALLVAAPAIASAAGGDIGVEDFSYSPLSDSPSGTKPESKLWFNDGWWGILYSPSHAGWDIMRLDGSTWSDTGPTVDNRSKARADTLWDPSTGKLYVASHGFLNAGHGFSFPAPNPADAGLLYRYTWHPDGGSYALDPGFPVAINDNASETLVIDKDSTGTLWATWTYGSRVYVSHTAGGDTAWSEPYVVPGSSTLDSDDISSLVHFGSATGVTWSDQSDTKVRFAVHPDGDGDTTWSTELVPTGATADDHINLKTDSAARVYAAVKTSESTGSAPLILLMVRDPGGGWRRAVFGNHSDSNTRPIVLVDEQHGLARVFATAPQPPSSSGQSGGDIVEKDTAINNLAFPSGPGATIIRNSGSPLMNDATSTKQEVDGSTGLVVLANDHGVNDYWHASIPLGLPPTAAAAGAVTSAEPTTPGVASNGVGAARQPATACTVRRHLSVPLPRSSRGAERRAGVRMKGARTRVVNGRRGKLPRSLRIVLPRLSGVVRVTVTVEVRRGGRSFFLVRRHHYHACPQRH